MCIAIAWEHKSPILQARPAVAHSSHPHTTAAEEGQQSNLPPRSLRGIEKGCLHPNLGANTQPHTHRTYPQAGPRTAPILPTSSIRNVLQEVHGHTEGSIPRQIGLWLSVRWSPEQNARLLNDVGHPIQSGKREMRSGPRPMWVRGLDWMPRGQRYMGKSLSPGGLPNEVSTGQRRGGSSGHQENAEHESTSLLLSTLRYLDFPCALISSPLNNAPPTAGGRMLSCRMAFQLLSVA